MAEAFAGAAAARPAAASGAGHHLPALDGLRGAAIALVLVFHLIAAGAPRPQAPADVVAFRVLELGWVGVELFFVLSGFLITGILLDDVGTPGYARRFYARRVLRIFPLYYLALVVCVALAPLLQPADPAGLRALVTRTGWLWGYGVNFLIARDGFDAVPLGMQHLWSLAIEEQFYLVWPLVVAWAARPAALRKTCVTLFVAAVVLRLLARDASVAGFVLPSVPPARISAAVYVLPFTRLDGLIAGAWIAAAMRDPAWQPRLAAWGHRLARASAVQLGLAVMAGVAALVALGSHPGYAAMQRAGYPGLALGFGVLLLAAVCAPASSTIGRLCGATPLRWLGRYSYGLYVWHWPTLFALATLGLRPDRLPRFGGLLLPAHLATGAALFAATAAVAVASWHLWEKRWLALKDVVAPPRRALDAATRPLAVSRTASEAPADTVSPAPAPSVHA